MPIDLGGDNLFGRMMRKITPQAPQMPYQGPIQDGPPQQFPPANPIAPSWMRQGFEGGTDMMLGALGLGQDSTMNRAGAMVPAMLGLGGMMGKVGGVGRAIGNNPMSSAGTVETALGHPSAWQKFGTPPINGSRNAGINPNAIPPYMSQQQPGITRGAPLLDDAGKFLGFDKNTNASFNAHVASSQNKLGPRAVPNKKAGLSPTDDKLERMMAKYKFGQKKAS